jgi:hypothetical protein
LHDVVEDASVTPATDEEESPEARSAMAKITAGGAF